MPLQSRHTVLVVDPDRAVGRHVQALLESSGFHVPRPCTAAADAQAAASSALPDLVLLDLAIVDDPAGQALVPALAGRRVPMVYLVAQSDRETIERAVEWHATGCLVKPLVDRQVLAEVFGALAQARRQTPRVDGASRLTAEDKLALIASIIAPHHAAAEVTATPRRVVAGITKDLHATLSARERQIVELLANGARVSTIAQRLQLSPHTVRNHLKSVFRKLNLHGQHELFEYWHEHASR